MCNGFAIPIAQLFGAHDDSDLRRHVANATWLCIAWGVVLTVVTVALTRPIMELMQTPADIIDGASTYIGWIFAGIPFVFLYNMVSAIMRALPITCSQVLSALWATAKPRFTSWC